MKILTIGDIHGRKVWQDLSFDPYDKVVFIGDYVDSFDESDEDILSNFMAIIEAKKKDPDNVLLLLGNHDMQYLYPGRYRCSGYRGEMALSLGILFEENKSLFQLAFQHKNYLFTHAGVSNGWYDRSYTAVEDILFSKLDLIQPPFADILNKALDTRFINILMDVGRSRSGSCKFGGPLWADKSELFDKFLFGLNQIVGHSPVDKIITITDRDNASITFTDCLASVTEFYEIDMED